MQLKPATQATELATAVAPHRGVFEKKQEILLIQATPFRPATSSLPIATTTRPRRPATAARAAGSYQLKRQQPDAATGPLASRGERKTPGSQLSLAPPAAPGPAVAPAPHSAEPAPAVAVASPTTTPEIIEVEVRRGPARPAAPARAVAAETPAAPARRRGLRLGGLLRQADHLVHGEPVSLAEATGLPETMTVQARLGGRLISKTIQL